MKDGYHLRGGKLFESRRGSWKRILSFCLDDPDQGPVVTLPIVPVWSSTLNFQRGEVAA